MNNEMRSLMDALDDFVVTRMNCRDAGAEGWGLEAEQRAQRFHADARDRVAGAMREAARAECRAVLRDLES